MVKNQQVFVKAPHFGVSPLDKRKIWTMYVDMIHLKGVVSKNLQKPYICGRGGYNSLGDGT